MLLHLNRQSTVQRTRVFKKVRQEIEAGCPRVRFERFKGLGGMNPSQLKVTTTDPATRTLALAIALALALARVVIDEEDPMATESFFIMLMGKKADLRFEYIQEHA
jgi:topoisomerase-4 subunit B